MRLLCKEYHVIECVGFQPRSQDLGKRSWERGCVGFVNLVVSLDHIYDTCKMPKLPEQYE